MEFEFECDFCHSAFSGNKELDQHVMDSHETVENIEKFLEKETKSKQTADVYVNKDDRNYKCNVCNAIPFDVFHEYQNHLKSHFTNFHGKQQSTKKGALKQVAFHIGISISVTMLYGSKSTAFES